MQELWDANGKVVATLEQDAAARRRARRRRRHAGGGGRGGAQQPATDTGKRNIQWNPVGPGLVYMQSVFGRRAERRRARRARRSRCAAAARGASAADGGSLHELAAAVRPERHEGDLRRQRSPDDVAYSADGKTMFVTDSGARVRGAHRRSVEAVQARPRRDAAGAAVASVVGGGGGGGGGGARRRQRRGRRARDEARRRTASRSSSSAATARRVFLAGTRTPGAKWDTQAPRPWVDKVDFETGQRSRVFESPADAYDEIVAPLDDDYSQFIYTHESPTMIRRRVSARHEGRHERRSSRRTRTSRRK